MMCPSPHLVRCCALVMKRKGRYPPPLKLQVTCKGAARRVAPSHFEMGVALECGRWTAAYRPQTSIGLGIRASECRVSSHSLKGARIQAERRTTLPQRRHSSVLWGTSAILRHIHLLTCRCSATRRTRLHPRSNDCTLGLLTATSGRSPRSVSWRRRQRLLTPCP